MIATDTSLNQLFLALADPSRRGMVDQLARGPASVKDLAGTQGIALPSAVKHLKILESVGLVSSNKAGRVRTFAARPQALDLVEDWLTNHRRAIERRFDRLEQLMADYPESEDGR